MGRNYNNAGRRIRGGFIALPYNLLDSPAWRSLSASAKVTFLMLKRRFYGGNNGEISLSCREVAYEAHVSKSTASRLFRELQEHGLIKQAKRGYFTGRQATTWTLTTEMLGAALASNEWKKWDPKKPFEVPDMTL